MDETTLMDKVYSISKRLMNLGSNMGDTQREQLLDETNVLLDYVSDQMAIMPPRGYLSQASASLLVTKLQLEGYTLAELLKF